MSTPGSGNAAPDGVHGTSVHGRKQTGGEALQLCLSFAQHLFFPFLRKPSKRGTSSRVSHRRFLTAELFVDFLPQGCF